LGINPIEKSINRVLFCTSPLQVINARSAMDYLATDGNKYNDYVVLVHPLLLDSTKGIIYDLAEIMGYKKVIDLTILHKSQESNYKYLTLFKKITKLKSIIIDKFNNYQDLRKNISETLLREIGLVNTIFFRNHYKFVDSLFIDTQKHAERYAIEDGFGDYVPHNWAFKTLNFYEIKHKFKSKLYSYSLFLTSLLTTGQYNLSKVLFLQEECTFLKSFTNIRNGNSVCVENNFKKNLEKIHQKNSNPDHIKVLIIGTLLDHRFKLDNRREVGIYNAVIEKIIQKYEITNNEICYKHHPRLDHENWVYKKNNLECKIYEYQNKSIADIELLNKNLKAVYSVGSTSLLYAKKIFNLDSYLIDFRNEHGHPSAYKKAYYLAKKFEIHIITV